MNQNHEPKRSNDVPATKGMLFEVRDELKSEFRSLEHRTDARFKDVDARFDRVEAKIDDVLAAVHRVGLLVEEQNARNIYVLDGHTNLNDRVTKIESHLKLK